MKDDDRRHTQFLFIEEVLGFFAVAFSAVVGETTLDAALTRPG